MTQAIKVPEIGENVESGVVVAVHINVGDTVAVDDTVIELETDKALVEIPSPFSGKVTEVLAEPGAKMKVGDVIARVDADADDDDHTEQDPVRDTTEDTTEDSTEDTDAETQTEDTAAEAEKSSDAATDEQTDPTTAGRTQPSVSSPDEADADAGKDQLYPDRQPAPAAPSVRRLARELGLNIDDINGSGSGGRISEADVKAHVRRWQARAGGTKDSLDHPGRPELPDFARWGAIDTEPLETVRRLTAESTARSWDNIPHVTQFDEADISDVTAFIDKNAPKAESAGGKLTLTAVVTKVCVEALKRFPRFNASIDVGAGRIVLKHYVHVGMAVDTPRGLLVPVIRDADRKSILELAEAISDLATRARRKKIKPDELEGGTFSISNQGGIGGVGFTPIVLWPQAAILGVSRSRLKPVWRQERFEPRTVLPLSLSYDHRIVDGADAARFLRWICQGLEHPMNLFLD
jgi:pyruvate dehydrogenase E2 component (dihydrolipoamide acetyltransferase)